ncbi:MAG TPA: hypothetical protein VF817_04565 [Patescibacteria group bacterium]
MAYVILYTILFSLATVISILLTGSRSFISGSNLTPSSILQMIFSWHFILGAGFAFFARLLFIMTNNALLKIPSLAGSSTTITMFITSVSMIFVVAANYLFLNERMGMSQGIGAGIILVGIFIIMR